MAKVIAFLADGTWNGKDVDKDGDGTPEITNVLKLYHNLLGEDTLESFALAAESERIATASDGRVLQIAKYLHGVGDSKNPIIKYVGGATGAGLVSRIVRGYTFICRNYQPGDAIIIAGFSRGAYTARALADMIAAVGIMDYSKLDHPGKDRAYLQGMYVWAHYQQQRPMTRHQPGPNEIWELAADQTYAVGEEHMIRNVKVAAVGVWDTVGSLGIPAIGRAKAPVDLFRFANTRLHPNVGHGFHALALDEERATFSPTTWEARAGIEQVWFAGSHGDVGGGYVDSALADFALEWMAHKLALGGAGLRYKNPPPVATRADACGVQHDSWLALPFCLRPRQQRAVPDDALLHRSVEARLACRNLRYRPAGRDGWSGRFVD